VRTTPDRIRHAISFEVIGLALVTPLGAWVYHLPLHDIGAVTLVSATIATVWNYVYNLLFDHAAQRLFQDVRKTIRMRVAHAVLFEIGLLAVLMPFIAWYLDVSLLQALVMDLSFALFYLVYAFCFNWAYDLAFPLPAPQPPEHEPNRSETS
jgi:uncharacterized membrane protein